jgi:hypothetical protein
MGSRQIAIALTVRLNRCEPNRNNSKFESEHLVSTGRLLYSYGPVTEYGDAMDSSYASVRRVILRLAIHTLIAWAGKGTPNSECAS